MGRLIIVSAPKDIPEALAAQGTEDGDLLCFCCRAKARLDAAGLASLFPDDLIALPDFNKLGLENLERTRLLCALLDETLKAAVPFLGRHDLAVAMPAFFSLKVFLDCALSSAIVLRDIAASGRPMTAFSAAGSWEDTLGGRRPLVPLLLDEVFALTGSISIIHHRHGLSLSRSIKTAFRRLHGLSRACVGDAIVLEDAHDVPLVRGLFPGSRWCPAERLLAGWECLGDDLRQACGLASASTRLRADMHSAILEALRGPRGSQILAAPVPGLGEFLSRAVAGYLADGLSPILPHAEAIRDRLTRHPPRLLLTAHCRLGIREAFLLTLARSENIPVVCYQEGGGMGYLRWPLFALDAEWSDYLLTYGPAVGHSPLCQGHARLISTGSLRLERLRPPRRPPGNRLSLYVV
ncbi:MAG: hypothetical protein PHF00_04765, partial [Elusimicrobia bacterium]|nr:hypothetical protein [Elusimicrobiota bacterium]